MKNCTSKVPSLITTLLILCTFSYGQEAKNLTKANDLFRSGDLSEAHKIFSRLRNPNATYEAKIKFAELTLLRNEFTTAEAYLNEILQTVPGDSAASRLLAETYYRQDRFGKLPALLKASNLHKKVKQIEYFVKNDLQPNLIAPFREEHRIKLVTTDLLPSIHVTINGKKGLFIIDTGAGETIVDDEFAASAGIQIFDEAEGIYAGGKKGKYAFGYAEDVMLDELKVSNVPVHVQSTAKYSPVVGGQKVSGIVGTIFLYHFVSSIDYKNGDLVLRTKDGKFEAPENAVEIPFWLANDHLILAQGSIKKSRSQLFLVDTGMAGAGFTCPKSTIERAKIKIDVGNSFEGAGGGGVISVTPFMIEELYLGSVKNQSTIVGLFGPFPEELEYKLGYRIGGLISHHFFDPTKSPLISAT